MLPRFEVMLAEEVLPKHFQRIPRKSGDGRVTAVESYRWSDGRYTADLAVEDSHLGLTLRDGYAEDNPDNTTEWIWSHRVELNDPGSIGEMEQWVRQRISRQEAWNAS